LRQDYYLWPIAVQPDADKATRMMTQTSLIEAGQVLLPKEAPWLADFQHELVTFPNGRHDDQVDSVSQFLNWAKNRGTGEAVYHIS
jgi:predicted phage terminase large subunit-like protein